MHPTAAAILANALSFAVCALIAAWYVAPWLRARPRAAALTALLWVHAFRHIALQIFSAQRAGFAVPDQIRDQIAYGDVLGMMLAVLAIVAVRLRWRAAIPITWVFVGETIADLANSLIGGVRQDLLASAYAVTWMIVTFYVPVLWTTLALIVWQLVTRRGAPLHA
jgi:hypothetical protein